MHSKHCCVSTSTPLSLAHLRFRETLTPVEVVAATLQLLLALVHSPLPLSLHVLGLALGLPGASLHVVILTEGHHTQGSRLVCRGAQGRQPGAGAARCSNGLQGMLAGQYRSRRYRWCAWQKQYAISAPSRACSGTARSCWCALCL